MNTRFLTMMSVAALCLSISCSKEDYDSITEPAGDGSFAVTIEGEMGEFAPTTKSAAESCIRMKWENGDVVWAYDKSGASLGKLDVTVESGNEYVALMKGTLSKAPEGGILILMHSGMASKATQPAYSDGLTVDLASGTQASDATPFVSYAKVEGVTDKEKYKETALKTKFDFATSILKVNATGIAKDAALTSASISGIQTVCKLTIDSDTGDVSVSNDGTTGTISKSLSGEATMSRAAFYIGVPAFGSASRRVLTVVAGGKDYFDYNVMQSAQAENKYVNYVYDVRTLDYTDEYGISRGDGIYIAATSLVWAPVNCGYEPTNFKYGKLYQWGRKYGSGYYHDYSSEEYRTKYNDVGGVIQQSSTSTSGIAASDENPAIFYKSPSDPYDWLASRDNYRWDATGGSCSSHTPVKTSMDPCPEGWRVPTASELEALYAGNMKGWSATEECFYFNGTNNCTSETSGPKLCLSAGGCRSYDDGDGDNRGCGGDYWSSSSSPAPYESAARDLSFFGTSVASYAIMSEGYRSQAYSVRCVQE